jgi:methyltransferase-like protein
MFRNILNLIKFDELSRKEREKLKKILQDRKASLEETIEEVNQKLTKKPKPKRTSKE